MLYSRKLVFKFSENLEKKTYSFVLEILKWEMVIFFELLLFKRGQKRHFILNLGGIGIIRGMWSNFLNQNVYLPICSDNTRPLFKILQFFYFL